jgi:hypothetical protein
MAGIRITDKATLERLIAKGMVKGDSVSALASLGPALRRKQGRADNGLICAMVPASPAHKLYQAIVRRFGRFYEGGLAVFELECRLLTGRRYRLDIALPLYRLGVELDGWQWHGKTLSGFQRDREKSLSFERRGWRVIRFSAAQVNNELSDVITAIEQIISYCQADPQITERVRPAGFDKSVLELKINE